MAHEHELSDPAAKAFVKTVAFAVEWTGTPSDRLSRDDFFKAAALAEEAGEVKMMPRLLLLAEDEETRQRDG